MSRGPGFPARHETVCPRCNLAILRGDAVVRARPGLIHVRCASGQDDQ